MFTVLHTKCNYDALTRNTMIMNDYNNYFNIFVV